ncbi:MAG TPA: chloride channel protein, partial [Dehalococcoidia bacterium]|nr:chloride channel protein [Dehalococcoidia bacterium]
LTGAAFASEVLLEELEPRRFSLLALAAVASTAVAQQFSVEQVITVPPLPAPPWQDVPLDVVLGLIAAPLGVALFLAVHTLGHRIEKSRVPFWLGPALGGLAVGAIGLLLPRVLGSGDTGIEQALGGHLETGLLLALPLAKLAATSITLGSGASGGVFTPSLFIGATLGGAFGAVIGRLWGGASPEPAYALVGMGTVVAAVVNAPLTAVLLVCEFTRNFTLLPQVVAAVAASVMLARRLHAESIYTLPLRLRGIDRALIRQSPLARIRVREVMTADWPTIAPDRTLRQAIGQARAAGRSVFPVVDAGGRFAGVLSLEQVAAALERADAAGQTGFEDHAVRELALRDVPLVDPDETLHEVALALAGAASFIPIVPVVRRQGDQYVGVLERAAILRSYSAAARLQDRSARSRQSQQQAKR